MGKISHTLLCLAAVLCFAGCTFLHDDKLVAVAAGKKLYRSQVVKYIPRGLSSQDSLKLAGEYIQSWAAELIMNEMADLQLSKQEKDVSAELEDYRSSLLKYRYEQHYIADRLDTVVTEAQIKSSYEANPQLYSLEVPILKVRYLRITAQSPMRDDLVRMLTSSDEDKLVVLDSLSRIFADKYSDFGGKWTDIVSLAREYGMDYGELIAAMKDSRIDITDVQGTEHISYVLEYIPGGNIAPLEYCTGKIRDVIIGQRKYALSSTLERELLDDAKKKGNFTIYDAEK